jgi:predicted nucleotidyltransferase
MNEADVDRVTSVPKSGTIVPEMGRVAKSPARGLASALFTPVQQRLLGLLFGQPDRRFQSAEIIRLAAGGTGAVHRQLQRLASTGLVNVTTEGNQKYYQANRQSPIFPEMHSLVVKTIGVVEPLRDALRPLEKQIDLAFVFGSVAKGNERSGSDLDLLVVSEDLGYGDIYQTILPVERTLSRTINPTVFTPAEWKRRLRQRDSFAQRVWSQPRLMVIGADNAAA